MNGLEAFNDIKVQLKKWTDECANKKHSTLHGATHIMGHGTPEVLDEQYALLKTYWNEFKKTLVAYKVWECESSGAYGKPKSGKVWDFCVSCSKCEPASGYGGAKKAPTFVYHVNEVPAQVPVQPSGVVKVDAVSGPQVVSTPSLLKGPGVGVSTGVETVKN